MTTRIVHTTDPPWQKIPLPRTKLDAIYSVAFTCGALMSARSNFHASMQVDTYVIGLMMAVLAVVYFGFRTP